MWQSNFITKCDGLLLQSATGITKCDRLFLPSASAIAKCDSYYKVRRNNLQSHYLSLHKTYLTLPGIKQESVEKYQQHPQTLLLLCFFITIVLSSPLEILKLV